MCSDGQSEVDEAGSSKETSVEGEGTRVCVVGQQWVSFMKGGPSEDVLSLAANDMPQFIYKLF